jgi:hypothetical protein
VSIYLKLKDFYWIVLEVPCFVSQLRLWWQLLQRYLIYPSPLTYRRDNIRWKTSPWSPIRHSNINNFLPVRCNKGRYVTSVHYVQSVGYDVIKQTVLCCWYLYFPRRCDAHLHHSRRSDKFLRPYIPSPASPTPWELGFNIIRNRFESNLPRPPAIRRFNFHCRKVPRTMMN